VLKIAERRAILARTNWRDGLGELYFVKATPASGTSCKVLHRRKRLLFIGTSIGSPLSADKSAAR